MGGNVYGRLDKPPAVIWRTSWLQGGCVSRFYGIGVWLKSLGRVDVMLGALFCLRRVPPPAIPDKTVLLGQAKGFNVVRYIGHRQTMTVVEIIEGAVQVTLVHRRFPLLMMMIPLFYNTMS